MNAGSYFEYFLTLLGWLVNNGVWHTLVVTGLFALPLLFKLIALWLKARGQGVDEGSSGALLVTWMEHSVYSAVVVIMFTGVPLLNLDLSTIQYDTSRSRQCGYSVVQPEDSGYRPLINELSNQTASVPVWWYFTHALSKGLTSAAVSVLPCRPDLRQIRFDVQHTRLADPALAQELLDFINDCYTPSRARLKRQATALSEEQSRDVDWIGSAFYLTTAGYYDSDYSHSPRSAWPWDSSRDDGLNNTGNGGYPTCRQWWTDSDVGLKTRLLNQVNTSLWQQLQKLGQSKEAYEEAVLRSLVSQRNMQVSQGGMVYNGFGGGAGDNLSRTQLLSRLGGIIGAGISSYALFPAFDNVRQALPMVQAFLEMALVICLPVILLFSGWELKAVITLSFVQFALFFLTFWWELARWLDSWLMQILYDSDTHSWANLYGLQNTSDDLIVNIIMGVMFLVLPMFWLGALTWAGIRVGGPIAGVIGNAVGDVRSAGEHIGKMIANKTRIP
ncbi:conjugal transfer protein TraG N-terminal domain-containing protein [Salmonella enterica]|nr:conjugal transfer protein TraG N-terminal domain-containing protein [Salmonella enterica]